MARPRRPTMSNLLHAPWKNVPPCTDVPSARWIGRWHPREADAELPPSMCIGNVPKARPYIAAGGRAPYPPRDAFGITPVGVQGKRAKGTSVHCDAMAGRLTHREADTELPPSACIGNVPKARPYMVTQPRAVAEFGIFPPPAAVPGRRGRAMARPYSLSSPHYSKPHLL